MSFIDEIQKRLETEAPNYGEIATRLEQEKMSNTLTANLRVQLNDLEREIRIRYETEFTQLANQAKVSYSNPAMDFVKRVIELDKPLNGRFMEVLPQWQQRIRLELDELIVLRRRLSSDQMWDDEKVNLLIGHIEYILNHDPTEASNYDWLRRHRILINTALNKGNWNKQKELTILREKITEREVSGTVFASQSVLQDEKREAVGSNLQRLLDDLEQDPNKTVMLDNNIVPLERVTLEGQSNYALICVANAMSEFTKATGMSPNRYADDTFIIDKTKSIRDIERHLARAYIMMKPSERFHDTSINKGYDLYLLPDPDRDYLPKDKPEYRDYWVSLERHTKNLLEQVIALNYEMMVIEQEIDLSNAALDFEEAQQMFSRLISIRQITEDPKVKDLIEISQSRIIGIVRQKLLDWQQLHQDDVNPKEIASLHEQLMMMSRDFSGLSRQTIQQLAKDTKTLLDNYQSPEKSRENFARWFEDFRREQDLAIRNELAETLMTRLEKATYLDPQKRIFYRQELSQFRQNYLNNIGTVEMDKDIDNIIRHEQLTLANTLKEEYENLAYDTISNDPIRSRYYILCAYILFLEANQVHGDARIQQYNDAHEMLGQVIIKTLDVIGGFAKTGHELYSTVEKLVINSRDVYQFLHESLTNSKQGVEYDDLGDVYYEWYREKNNLDAPINYSPYDKNTQQYTIWSEYMTYFAEKEWKPYLYSRIKKLETHSDIEQFANIDRQVGLLESEGRWYTPEDNSYRTTLLRLRRKLYPRLHIESAFQETSLFGLGLTTEEYQNWLSTANSAEARYISVYYVISSYNEEQSKMTNWQAKLRAYRAMLDSQGDSSLLEIDQQMVKNIFGNAHSSAMLVMAFVYAIANFMSRANYTSSERDEWLGVINTQLNKIKSQVILNLGLLNLWERWLKVAKIIFEPNKESDHRIIMELNTHYVQYQKEKANLSAPKEDETYQWLQHHITQIWDVIDERRKTSINLALQNRVSDLFRYGGMPPANESANYLAYAAIAKSSEWVIGSVKDSLEKISDTLRNNTTDIIEYYNRQILIIVEQSPSFEQGIDAILMSAEDLKAQMMLLKETLNINIDNQLQAQPDRPILRVNGLILELDELKKELVQWKDELQKALRPTNRFKNWLNQSTMNQITKCHQLVDTRLNNIQRIIPQGQQNSYPDYARATLRQYEACYQLMTRLKQSHDDFVTMLNNITTSNHIQASNISFDDVQNLIDLFPDEKQLSANANNGTILYYEQQRSNLQQVKSIEEDINNILRIYHDIFSSPNEPSFTFAFPKPIMIKKEITMYADALDRFGMQSKPEPMTFDEHIELVEKLVEHTDLLTQKFEDVHKLSMILNTRFISLMAWVNFFASLSHRFYDDELPSQEVSLSQLEYIATQPLGNDVPPVAFELLDNEISLLKKDIQKLKTTFNNLINEQENDPTHVLKVLMTLRFAPVIGIFYDIVQGVIFDSFNNYTRLYQNQLLINNQDELNADIRNLTALNQQLNRYQLTKSPRAVLDTLISLVNTYFVPISGFLETYKMRVDAMIYEMQHDIEEMILDSQRRVSRLEKLMGKKTASIDETRKTNFEKLIRSLQRIR